MATCLNLLSGASLFLGCIPEGYSWRLRFQKDAKLLNAEKRSHIELKIRELANKLKISKPIELIEIKGLMGSAQGQGNAILPFRIGIIINPEFVDKISEAELEFVIAHELSHIKANDIILTGTVSSIVGFITTLAMSIMFPSSATHFSPLVPITLMISSPAAAIGLTVSAIAFVIFLKWREECADRLGFSICSDAAQKAVPTFFDRIRISQISYRNNQEGSCLSKFWRRFLITEDGDYRFDILHPTIKTRINYLQPNHVRNRPLSQS